MAACRLSLVLLAAGLLATVLLAAAPAAADGGSDSSESSGSTDTSESSDCSDCHEDHHAHHHHYHHHHRRCCGKGEILPMSRPCRQPCCKIWRPVCVAGPHTPMTTVANPCEASRLACQRREERLFVVCYHACPGDSNVRPPHYNKDEDNHKPYPCCGCDRDCDCKH